MTKLLVLSDSHGARDAIKRILNKEQNNVDAVIFLGDGLRDLEQALAFFPHLRVYSVAGNCDFGALEPLDGLAGFDQTVVFYTHGHMYGVKYDLDTLADAAAARLSTACCPRCSKVCAAGTGAARKAASTSAALRAKMHSAANSTAACKKGTALLCPAGRRQGPLLRMARPPFRPQWDDLKWLPLRSSHVQRKNYFKFRVCRALRSAPNAFSRKGFGTNSLSQNLSVLPAPSGREPLAWWYSFRLKCKACGCACSPLGELSRSD